MKQKYPVTGLNFGSVYFTEAEAFLENSDEKQYCIIALDIENFHLFNHIHGEEKGDKLLQVISQVLLEYQKEHESVLGYFGGDNFSLLTEYNKNVLEQLCYSIREEIRIQNKTTGFPAGYGVYVIKDKQESVYSMYKHALAALSYVIGNFSCRYCEYDMDMDEKQEEELHLLSEIQRGIEEDEFIFYIQPQIEIESNKIVGGESLIRWHREKKEIVSPGLFIPLMEKNGLVADLDQIIWDKVCAWIRSCLDRGYHPVPISINLSRIDIFSLDVPKYLVSLIEKYDISEEFLKIEITESAYAEDEEYIVGTVNQLREKGFVVMMDDFGSGYSSLNMLKSVPIDILKMDMRFLEINEKEEEKGVGILESVVNMARQMRIPIVVEGVEMQTQENLLRKMGCSYTQGFYYYRPMPVSDFEKILENDNKLDHNGFWYHQPRGVSIRKLLDVNLFDDTLVSNILGPSIFCEIVDNEIEIIRVNSMCCELIGISQHERVKFLDSVREDDKATLYAIFEEAYQKKEEGAVGYIHFMRKDKVVIWLYVRVYFLWEKEGHKSFYASLMDMTSEKPNLLVLDSSLQHLSEFSKEQNGNGEECSEVLPATFAVGTPMFDENGTVYDFEINYPYVNDVFYRGKRSDVHKELAKIFETMSDGFFIYFADGDKKILYANAAIFRIFGCSTMEEFKELTGNSFTGFVHPEDLNRVEWEIKRQIEEVRRDMDYIRYRIVRKDGTVRWVDDVGHLKSTGYVIAPKLFYVFIADISDKITESEKYKRILSSRQFNPEKDSINL